MSIGFIYLIQNKVNDKCYVGRTVRSLAVRLASHVKAATRNETNMLIVKAIQKHGDKSFEISMLEECERETFWIKELKTHVSMGGYNLTLGGDGGIPGYKFSDETKEKLRLTSTGKTHTQDVKDKISKSRSKSVLQYDLNGELVASYHSLKEACITTKINMTAIQRSLYNGQPKHGFSWKYNLNEEKKVG